jgi:fluoroquinolone resistance protein
MDRKIIQNSIFERIDFTKIPLAKCEYENGNFFVCDFSNSPLAGIVSLICRFIAPNLSMAKLTRTIYSDTQFIDCKRLGLRFGNCVQLALSIGKENCNLNHSSFYKTIPGNAPFKNSRLPEMDFAESDLSHSVFANYDLDGSIFDNTNLEKADLRSAFNYNIDPDKDRIRKAKFSLDGVPAY